MIRHVVMFKFKAETSETERTTFVSMLFKLAEDIDFVRQLEVGENVVPSSRACDVVLMVDVDDEQALQSYGDHPLHQPVKQMAGQICEASYVVDYVLP
jgi:hypothetical protein